MSAPLPPPEGWLAALHGELRRILPARLHAQLDSWMESGTIELSPKGQGPGGTIVGYASYTAVFSIEELPFRQFPPQLLLAAVATWVQEHDATRDEQGLDDPTYTVTPIDERLADMELSLPFREPLSVIADPDGPLQWLGQTWRIAPYDVWAAEQADVRVSIEES
ncbi:phage tail protein [Aeromonas enteropelogenes]|uniref:phage tail protein n=1 Tax=Aeromonas enteropelogenes TaxID=29489 RepID=UPI002285D364|nr:phage tail protein [Aeromonas enteropelogenes]MCZ0751142.1 phage tail protein [Aeromonas enteropelogenes]